MTTEEINKVSEDDEDLYLECCETDNDEPEINAEDIKRELVKRILCDISQDLSNFCYSGSIKSPHTKEQSVSIVGNGIFKTLTYNTYTIIGNARDNKLGYDYLLVQKDEHQKKLYYNDDSIFDPPTLFDSENVSINVVEYMLDNDYSYAMFVYNRTYNNIIENFSPYGKLCFGKFIRKSSSSVLVDSLVDDSKYGKDYEYLETPHIKSIYDANLCELIMINKYPTNIQCRINQINAEIDSGDLPRSLVEKYKLALKYILSISPVTQDKEIVPYDKIKAYFDAHVTKQDALKDKICKYIYVSQFSQKKQALCLVGKPGTGKSYIAELMGKVLDKPMIYIPCSSCSDPIDFIGLTMEYSDSKAGKFVNAFKEKRTTDTVVVLNEFDKMTVRTNSGDPYACFTDILESSTNLLYDAFCDCSFDISNTIFVCTANTLDTIPEHLLNRMEIIETETYSNECKKSIAKNHIINKVLKNYPRFAKRVSFTDDALDMIINSTSDYGIRDTETEIKSLVRDALPLLDINGRNKVIIDKEFINENYIEKVTSNRTGF